MAYTPEYTASDLGSLGIDIAGNVMAAIAQYVEILVLFAIVTAFITAVILILNKLLANRGGILGVFGK